MNARVKFRVGTRGSRLARLQTEFAIAQLCRLWPLLEFEMVVVSTAGDRDQTTPLEESPPDFFTRDLDEELLAGRIDCAVHSAKDLPREMAAGIDWCWLPWREDARDTLVCRPGVQLAQLPPDLAIGVSSARRAAWCRQEFPGARLLPIRGDIPARLAQLDAGNYDLIVVAAAALRRLGLAERATRWLSEQEMAPPEGQGVLALTFREDDRRWLTLRSYFVKSLTFAAAGVGESGHVTLATLRALRSADIVLHDALIGYGVEELLPRGRAQWHNVGKRAGRHQVPQEETTAMMLRYLRQGLRVVRLKGGDPGIFGRLDEEVAALERHALPYRVLPGVSSLTAATSVTGMLLTRRGAQRGFTVLTPRLAAGGVGRVTADERAGLPLVAFMAVQVLPEVVAQLVDEEGMAGDTPAAVVFNAGSDQSVVIRGTLATIAGRVAGAENRTAPGLLLVGAPAAGGFDSQGALAGMRVLITASAALQERAAAAVLDYGGVPVARPLIRLELERSALEPLRRLSDYDWVILTSPSAVRCLGELLICGGFDWRRIRRLVAAGSGTAVALRQFGVVPDLVPADSFGSKGISAALTPLLRGGERLLRLESAAGTPELAEALEAAGAVVESVVLYRNHLVPHAVMPQCEAIFFASSSAVAAFVEVWGKAVLQGRLVVAIGAATRAALLALGVGTVVCGSEVTVSSAVAALAQAQVAGRLAQAAADFRESQG